MLLRVPARTFRVPNNSRIPVISAEQQSAVFVRLCIPTVLYYKSTMMVNDELGTI